MRFILSLLFTGAAYVIGVTILCIIVIGWGLARDSGASDAEYFGFIRDLYHHYIK